MKTKYIILSFILVLFGFILGKQLDFVPDQNILLTIISGAFVILVITLFVVIQIIGMQNMRGIKKGYKDATNDIMQAVNDVYQKEGVNKVADKMIKNLKISKKSTKNIHEVHTNIH